MGLIKKLMVICFIIILLPAVYLGSQSYSRTLKDIEREYINEANSNTTNVKNSILYKIDTAVDIMQRLSMDQRLNRLLSSEHIRIEELLESYSYYLTPLFDNAIIFNKANVCNISVYTNNTNLTESWKYFYQLDRLLSSEWYNAFIQGTEDSIWLGTHPIDLFARIRNPDTTEVFSFVKKLYSVDRRYLGIMVLDIKVNDMLSDYIFLSDSNNYLFCILDRSNNVLFPAETILPTTIKQTNLEQKGYDFQGDTLYTWDNVDLLGIKIVNVLKNENMKMHLRKTSINMVLIYSMFIIFMLFLLNLLLRSTFREIGHMIDVMQDVTKGNLNKRIPFKYNNEVGKIAYNFNILIDRINILIKDIVKKENDKKDSQFAALQYQMNPHFIYNTIDIINSKLELDGHYDAVEAIYAFSKILRYNMDFSYKFVQINDEIENVINYIELQKLKHGNTINLSVNLPADLANYKILKFLLQPIVENSIKHGFEKNKYNININIEFCIVGDVIEIIVTDDGIGISADKLDIINHAMKENIDDNEQISNSLELYKSIGLRNVNNRIRLFYGQNYSICIDSQTGQYTKVVITIPVVSQANLQRVRQDNMQEEKLS